MCLKKVIVGFDPGMTSGLAIIDLEKNVVSLSTHREEGPEEIIEKIRQAGQPVIFACDVSPVQKSVRKLAAAFSAATWCPELSMSVVEKLELCKEYDVKNSHERDALAAALKAFESHKNLLDRAKKTAENFETAFENVIKGRQPNLAFRKAEKQPVEKKFSLPPALKLKVARNTIKKLKELMEQQRLRMDLLEREIASLKHEVNALQESKPKAEKREESEGLKDKIKRMDTELLAFKNGLSKFEGRSVVILPASLQGDVIFVPVFDEVAEKATNAKVIITCKKLANSDKAEVVLLGAIDGISVGGWAIIPQEKFPKVSGAWLDKFVKNYRRRKL